MKLVFWLSLTGILYTYIGYPLILWVLARVRARPWTPAPIHPSVSIVLAVRNGMSLLEYRVQQLLSLDYPNLQELIVVSDGSTDGTADFLSAQKLPRLRAIILPEHGGKATAVNAGIAQATGELIVFVDLRPEIAPGALQQLVSNFADPQIGCVAGEYVLARNDEADGSASVGRAYWLYEQWLRNREAGIDSVVGVPGCFYSVRRALATRQPPGIILDDMFQPLAVVRQGYRSVVDPKALVVDKWPPKIEGEFRRKVRTLAGNFQLVALAPWILSGQNRILFQFFSHKLMRLLVPYLMVLLLISSAVLARTSTFFAVLTVVQVVGCLLAIVGGRYKIPLVSRIAGPANALLVLNAAAVVGLYKFLFTRGPLWKIWTTGRSTDVASPGMT
ncbi:MAG TPA: glycosyltransferase family 2 protein [Acidobacteriaceae bacterium]|nr:glycosyltransferase family 2 protein [Acidobacteriaceae bacterium]